MQTSKDGWKVEEIEKSWEPSGDAQIVNLRSHANAAQSLFQVGPKRIAASKLGEQKFFRKKIIETQIKA